MGLWYGHLSLWLLHRWMSKYYLFKCKHNNNARLPMIGLIFSSRDRYVPLIHNVWCYTLNKQRNDMAICIKAFTLHHSHITGVHTWWIDFATVCCDYLSVCLKILVDVNCQHTSLDRFTICLGILFGVATLNSDYLLLILVVAVVVVVVVVIIHFPKFSKICSNFILYDYTFCYIYIFYIVFISVSTPTATRNLRKFSICTLTMRHHKNSDFFGYHRIICCGKEWNLFSGTVWVANLFEV